MNKLITTLAICNCAWAQNAVNRPQIGKMLDTNGAVRTVYGISASVTLGDAEMVGVLSSACSQTFCLAKTETNIVSATSNVDVPAGPALFAFDGTTVYVWFPQSRRLAEWRTGIINMLDSHVDGRVISIGASKGAVQFAVRRMNGVWIVNPDGSVADALPRSTGPVMLIPGGVVYATRDEIVIRNLRFPLKGVTAFSQMSGSYLQVRAGGLDYSLRIDQGREALFQLPGAQQ